MQMQEYCCKKMVKKQGFSTTRAMNKHNDKKNTGVSDQQIKKACSTGNTRRVKTFSSLLKRVLTVSFLIPGRHRAEITVNGAQELRCASTKTGHSEERLAYFEPAI
jgi:YbbR domain-containing protein